jgi:hypothetical protein
MDEEREVPTAAETARDILEERAEIQERVEAPEPADLGPTDE